MRTREIIRDIQKSLFRMRVSKGRYLSDVSYQELTDTEREAIRREAKDIYYRTGLELRRIIRRGEPVWRFFDRD